MRKSSSTSTLASKGKRYEGAFTGTTSRKTVQGYLMKQGRINTGWRQRWFVLEGEKLWYYKNHSDSKPISYIPLRDSVVREAKKSSSQRLCFEVVTKSRVFCLSCTSRADMQAWITALAARTELATENNLIVEAELEIEQFNLQYSLRTLPVEDHSSDGQVK